MSTPDVIKVLFTLRECCFPFFDRVCVCVCVFVLFGGIGVVLRVVVYLVFGLEELLFIVLEYLLALIFLSFLLVDGGIMNDGGGKHTLTCPQILRWMPWTSSAPLKS